MIQLEPVTSRRYWKWVGWWTVVTGLGWWAGWW